MQPSEKSTNRQASGWLMQRSIGKRLVQTELSQKATGWWIERIAAVLRDGTQVITQCFHLPEVLSWNSLDRLHPKVEGMTSVRPRGRGYPFQGSPLLSNQSRDFLFFASQRQLDSQLFVLFSQWAERKKKKSEQILPSTQTSLMEESGTLHCQNTLPSSCRLKFSSFSVQQKSIQRLTSIEWEWPRTD